MARMKTTAYLAFMSTSAQWKKCNSDSARGAYWHLTQRAIALTSER
jgi:hypothetical protein